VLFRTAQTSAVEPLFTPDEFTIHKTLIRPVLERNQVKMARNYYQEDHMGKQFSDNVDVS
jgi:septin family protein